MSAPTGGCGTRTRGRSSAHRAARRPVHRKGGQPRGASAARRSRPRALVKLTLNACLRRRADGYRSVAVFDDLLACGIRRPPRAEASGCPSAPCPGHCPRAWRARVPAVLGSRGRGTSDQTWRRCEWRQRADRNQSSCRAAAQIRRTSVGATGLRGPIPARGSFSGPGSRRGRKAGAGTGQTPYFGRSSLSHSPHCVPATPSCCRFHGSSKDENQNSLTPSRRAHCCTSTK